VTEQPAPEQAQQEDLTADDAKVSPTDNGWKDGDGPQPAQTTTPALGSFTGEQVHPL
jgi:hypothetical protein